MFTRRRHVIASPAICKPPWPPPPPYPPGTSCYCQIPATWNPDYHEIAGTFVAVLTPAESGYLVKAWVHSTPELAWDNPYTFAEHHPGLNFTIAVPAGTTSVEITVGYVFSNGAKCSAHNVVPTPGA